MNKLSRVESKLWSEVCLESQGKAVVAVWATEWPGSRQIRGISSSCRAVRGADSVELLSFYGSVNAGWGRYLTVLICVQDDL